MKIITIGSDPEFVIVDAEGKIIDANFSEACKKRCVNRPKGMDCTVECSEQNPFCSFYSLPRIGRDCGLGELRPLQGNIPQDHMDNITNLFKYLELPKGFHAYAGTCYADAAIGGHIHIGLKTNDAALSTYLSYYSGIPLKKIERESDLLYRGIMEDTYGFFGTYTSKEYGIEWRMPASWLLSKEITLAALSLTYIAAQEFDKNPEYFAISNNAYRALVNGKIEPIIGKIERMENFPLYHKEIEPLLQMITNEEKWDTKRDIIEEWT